MEFFSHFENFATRNGACHEKKRATIRKDRGPFR